MSLQAVKSRNADEKARGVVRVHPEHAGGGRKPPVPLPVCAHEGAVAQHCGCAAEDRHVRYCEHAGGDTYGRCVRGAADKAEPGEVQNCATCPDHTARPRAPAFPRPTPTVRHLLYHVYPRAGGDWRTPVLRLRERIDLFNGRRLIAVATDRTTEAAVMVADALAGCNVELVEVANNPARREVATFPALFSRVADLRDPEHCTLYGHAKGVTRPADSTAARWGEALAELCLDFWPLVADQLTRFGVTGPFKKVGRGWPAHESASAWHYSGSWFWFRNDALFTRPDWKRIDPFWGGIEPYLSLHFGAAEAGSLFHAGTVPDLNLYDGDYWRRHVEPELREFRAARRPEPPRPPSPLLNLGCGPHRADGWLNADVVRTAAIRPDELVAVGRLLPWADGAFDRAYLGHVLEHVAWEAVPALLAELRRVVRAGGEVCVVGPDLLRAVARVAADPDTAGAVSHVREVIEDDEHHQLADLGREWDGARHRWNCYAARVVRALVAAGFADVRERDLGELEAWPVVDRNNPYQCCVTGRVP